VPGDPCHLAYSRWYAEHVSLPEGGELDPEEEEWRRVGMPELETATGGVPCSEALLDPASDILPTHACPATLLASVWGFARWYWSAPDDGTLPWWRSWPLPAGYRSAPRWEEQVRSGWQLSPEVPVWRPPPLDPSQPEAWLGCVLHRRSQAGDVLVLGLVALVEGTEAAGVWRFVEPVKALWPSLTTPNVKALEKTARQTGRWYGEYLIGRNLGGRPPSPPTAAELQAYHTASYELQPVDRNPKALSVRMRIPLEEQGLDSSRVTSPWISKWQREEVLPRDPKARRRRRTPRAK